MRACSASCASPPQALTRDADATWTHDSVRTLRYFEIVCSWVEVDLDGGKYVL